MTPKSSLRSAPYSRRPTTQPKSSRQQFSACGACRMRRVRCDLKDLSLTGSAPYPGCSNCKERGLKCVDEFADVKAVKLLRRGRRLQQVEAIYGKTEEDDAAALDIISSPQPSSIIPHLKPEFFSSHFWHRFCAHHPIFTDFPARFFAHLEGAPFLSPEGKLLGMVLVVWATSFGIDERGDEISPENLTAAPTTVPSMSASTSTGDNMKRRHDGSSDGAHNSRALRDRTSQMVLEILPHIDSLSILRHPTWDGLRVLLLVLGIAEEVQSPIDKLTMHEATLSQVYTLCGLASASPPSSGSSSSQTENELRARIFWYAYVHEATTVGLQGGRLIFDDDDLALFQSRSPHIPLPIALHSSTPPSPVSPTFPAQLPYEVSQLHQEHQQVAPHISQQSGSIYHQEEENYHHSHHSRPQSAHTPPHQPHLLTAHVFALPLHFAAICRRVHLVLTGPKARRAGAIDEQALFQVWSSLERCWAEFEVLRRNGAVGFGSKEEIERFVAGWQIRIFACYNNIREVLKQLLVSAPADLPNCHAPNGGYAPSNAPSPTNSHHSQSPHSSYPNTPTTPSFPASHAVIQQLHAIARSKCHALLPRVLGIIKRHVTVDAEGCSGTGLFRWDAGIVRDGCFFAAFLFAEGDGELNQGRTRDGGNSFIDQEEGVEICLRALQEMQWGFSKSEERNHTVRMVWDVKVARDQRQTTEGYPHRREVDMDHGAGPYGHPHEGYDHHGALLQIPAHHPPLSSNSHTTANVMDGHGTGSGTWSTYTPPGSATTLSSSPSIGRASPSYPALGGQSVVRYKNEPGSGVATGSGEFYVGSELDPFTYSVPVGDGPTCSDSNSGAYALRQGQGQERHSSVSMQAHMGGQGHGYLDPAVVFAAGEDLGLCPQFGADCNGFYH